MTVIVKNEEEVASFGHSDRNAMIFEGEFLARSCGKVVKKEKRHQG